MDKNRAVNNINILGQEEVNRETGRIVQERQLSLSKFALLLEQRVKGIGGEN